MPHLRQLFIQRRQGRARLGQGRGLRQYSLLCYGAEDRIAAVEHLAVFAGPGSSFCVASIWPRKEASNMAVVTTLDVRLRRAGFKLEALIFFSPELSTSIWRRVPPKISRPQVTLIEALYKVKGGMAEEAPNAAPAIFSRVPLKPASTCGSSGPIPASVFSLIATRCQRLLAAPRRDRDYS